MGSGGFPYKREPEDVSAAPQIPAEAMKPCPFCGDPDPYVERSDEIFRHVACRGCGALGPVAGTEDEDEEFGHDYVAAAKRDAIAGWNSAPRRRRSRKPRG